jgi:hypothetical protein
MTIAVGGADRAQASPWQVNLRVLWDVVSAITVGSAGAWLRARISLVLQKTDLSMLPQVQAAGDAAERGTREGRRRDQWTEVLTAHEAIIRRLVRLVEQPPRGVCAARRLHPAHIADRGSACGGAGGLLSGRMATPIQALTAGSTDRRGRLDRIEVHTRRSGGAGGGSTR